MGLLQKAKNVVWTQKQSSCSRSPFMSVVSVDVLAFVLQIPVLMMH